MNRALLELETGILLYAVLGQIIILLFTKERLNITIGWWAGIATALFWAWHMWRSLDKALDFSEGDAVKKVRFAAVIRYLVSCAVVLALAMTEAGNFLAGIFGIFVLKVSAYSQPLTHKFYNKIFHEQDPVPEPLPEEEFFEIYPGEAKEKEAEK